MLNVRSKWVNNHHLKSNIHRLIFFIFIIMVFVDSLFSFSLSEIGMANPPTLLVTRCTWLGFGGRYLTISCDRKIGFICSKYAQGNYLHSKRIFSYFLFLSYLGHLLLWVVVFSRTTGSMFTKLSM